MKAVYRDRQALRDVNTCGICGKDFLPRGDLVGHMRSLHGANVGMGRSEEPSVVWNCGICGREFDTTGEMEKHLDKDHTRVH